VGLCICLLLSPIAVINGALIFKFNDKPFRNLNDYPVFRVKGLSARSREQTHAQTTRADLAFPRDRLDPSLIILSSAKISYICEKYIAFPRLRFPRTTVAPKLYRITPFGTMCSAILDFHQPTLPHPVMPRDWRRRSADVGGLHLATANNGQGQGWMGGDPVEIE